MSPGRTFRTVVRPLSEVYGDHGPLQQAVDAFEVVIDDLEPVWLALRGRYEGRDRLALATLHTMPDYDAPLVATCEVAAVYALTKILEQVQRVTDRDNDLLMRAACRRAWDEFEQRRLLANAIREGFGCDDSAAWHLMRSTENHPHVEEQMRRIAELAGAMHKAFAHVVRTVPSDDPQSVVGAERGGDPERLLTDEIAKMADRDMADMQTIEVLEGRAQQYKMRGRRRQARGPLVLALDESSSMHDGGHPNDRNTWSKACAVALTRVAHEEHRDVVCVHWSTSVKVQNLKPGDTRAMWEMAHSFMSGGTTMGRALSASKREIERLKKEGKPGADVVLVSDGTTYEQLGDQIKAMKAQDIGLWGVSIGVEWRKDFAPRAEAERYVHVADSALNQKDTAARLAKELSGAAIARETKDLN